MRGLKKKIMFNKHAVLNKIHTILFNMECEMNKIGIFH